MPLYNGTMQSYILDAASIDPNKDPAEFLSEFYNVQKLDLFELKRLLYASEQIRITEVFNWPAQSENWKGIAAALESIQQHSASFYVIWGPETHDAITYDEKRLESEKTDVPSHAETAVCKDVSDTPAA